MTRPQHFVSISGGKDSTATACLAIEQAERRGYTPRFLFADTGNEHDITIEHVAYLADALGIKHRHRLPCDRAGGAARLHAPLPLRRYRQRA
ncbi:MAG: phosphoadenosine phosphosulfate reductase family protein [Candidatus Phytoplasma sp. TWB_XP]